MRLLSYLCHYFLLTIRDVCALFVTEREEPSDEIQRVAKDGKKEHVVIISH